MVEFKNIPSWLKGGLIALGIAIVMRFLLELGIFEFLGWILYYIPTSLIALNYDLPFRMLFVSLVFWTLVGIIIGLIVGKIKSSKKK